jgi:hypothetical protein
VQLVEGRPVILGIPSRLQGKALASRDDARLHPRGRARDEHEHATLVASPANRRSTPAGLLRRQHRDSRGAPSTVLFVVRGVRWSCRSVPGGTGTATSTHHPSVGTSSARCWLPNTATRRSSRRHTNCRWTATPCNMPAVRIHTSQWPSIWSDSIWCSKLGCVRLTSPSSSRLWPRGSMIGQSSRFRQGRGR